MSRSPRYRNWMITVNNPTEGDMDSTKNIQENSGFGYMVYQIEKGEQGTTHIQGYIEFKAKVNLLTMKTYWPRGHFEPRRGTQKQAIAYCTKQATRTDPPVFAGEPKRQGQRMDLVEYRDNILGGDTDRDLIMENLGCFARYPNLRYDIRNILYSDRADEIQNSRDGRRVIIKWGPTGVGKTRSIIDEHGQQNVFRLVIGDGSSKSLWWDGYEGQPVTVVEEFYGNMKFSYLLQLTDRYKLHVQVKGAKIVFCSKTIYFTSNTDPQEWYPNIRNESMNAFTRRLTHVYHVSESLYEIEDLLNASDDEFEEEHQPEEL